MKTSQTNNLLNYNHIVNILQHSISKFIICILLVPALHINISAKKGWQETYDSTLYYISSGNYDEALKHGRKTLSLALETFGKADTNYINSNDLMIEIYASISEFDSAISRTTENLELLESHFPDEKIRIAETANNLAIFYANTGRYSKSLPFCFRALEMYRDFYKGDDNEKVAETLNNLGFFYRKNGDFEKAVEVYGKCLSVGRKVFKNDSGNIAIFINNLAAVYKETGDYEEAEALYTEALDIRRGINEGDNENLSISINNLASLYSETGEYGKAEELLLESIEMNKRIYEKNDPKTVNAMNNLALVYDHIGRYKEAKKLYEEIIAIYKNSYKANHPDMAVILNNLAELHKRYYKYNEAEKCFTRALELNIKFFDVTNNVTIENMNNLAVLYSDMGRYKQAKLLFSKALDAAEKVYGVEHPEIARIENNRAVMHHVKGNFQKAELLLNKALAMNRKFFSDKHPAVLDNINSLATLYADMGRFEKADSLYLTLQGARKEQLLNNFQFMSEKDKGRFMFTIYGSYYLFNSYCIQRSVDNPDLLIAMYENQLLLKGILLSSTRKLRNSILESGDSTLINTYKKWISTKKDLSEIYRLNPSIIENYGINTDSIEMKANRYEKYLTKNSGIFAKGYSHKTTRWDEIRNSLGTGEAAVEFVRFRFYNGRWTDSVFYAALVTTRQSLKPGLVVFTEGRKMDSLYYRHYLRYVKNPATAGEPPSLHYWQPLTNILKGIKKVYVSADGVYQKINLNTLMDPATGKFLVEQVDIQLVSSTKVIPQIKTNKEALKISRAALFGDIKYHLDESEITNAESIFRNIKLDDDEVMKLVRTDTNSKEVEQLPSTKEEINRIGELLRKKGCSVETFVNSDATEDAFKSLKNYDVIHIATHGIFYNSRRKKAGQDMILGLEAEKFLDEPLLRSFLLFAGADNTINHNQGSVMKEDGLLTAYEVMNLDLGRTGLVVLSACKTGLGEIKNGEGVYGLQRAFRLAGVRNILMSLWNVPDRDTMRLMIKFYSKWLSGIPLREAFRQSQLEMLRSNPIPRSWGSFILMSE